MAAAAAASTGDGDGDGDDDNDKGNDNHDDDHEEEDEDEDEDEDDEDEGDNTAKYVFKWRCSLHHAGSVRWCFWAPCCRSELVSSGQQSLFPDGPQMRNI